MLLRGRGGGDAVTRQPGLETVGRVLGAALWVVLVVGLGVVLGAVALAGMGLWP